VKRPPLNGTVLITGASSGIGRELARQLAPMAECLVLTGRRADRIAALAEELRRLKASLRVVAQPCDLADMAAIDHMLAAVAENAGPVDVLVNCAGVGEQQVFARADWEVVRRVLDVNVTALALLTHRLLPGMVERGRGGILNVGSGAGFTMLPGAATYAGSKYFVHGFTETLRAELEGTGVVVTHVAPGPVETEFMEAGGIVSLKSGPPPFLWITAEQCAREAIRGFQRGQALVLPGTAYRMLMRLLPVVPRPILRLAFRPMAEEMRKLRRER